MSWVEHHAVAQARMVSELRCEPISLLIAG